MTSPPGSAGATTAQADTAEPRQRTVAGRLLIAALAEADRANAAQSQAARLEYLADLDRRLLSSLDEGRTRDTVAQVVLPELDAWAVVDLVESGGAVVRLAIVHSDSAKQDVVELLNAQWVPRADDPIGYAAAKRGGKPLALVEHLGPTIAQAAHTDENLALLQALGVAACLVVPITIEEEIDGAITFMSARPRVGYTEAEIAFAEKVAVACGRALRNARRFTAANDRWAVAEDSNRAKTTLLGHVTHELRTPLSAIGGYAELIQQGVRGPVTDQQRRDLERIRWNQQHLLSLISQILSFVRVDTGHVEYAITDVDLGAVVRDAGGMLEPLIADKRQALIFENCEAGVALARADAGKLRQIAINLITNAVKYSPPDARIIVRCEASLTEVFLDVSDPGTGIAADQFEAIFDPFVQLPGGQHARAGGVGLGLSIARQLARGMQGDLTVQSTLGLGSTFRLRLPTAARTRRSTDRRP